MTSVASSMPLSGSAGLDLVGLHRCRCQPDLETALHQRIAALLAPKSFVLALYAGSDRQLAVRFGDAEGPWEFDALLPAESLPGWHRLPVTYGEHVLGALFCADAPALTVAESLPLLLDHFGTALANLTIDCEARSSSAHYCASLQALEEGIVLFQESDRDTVLARLLTLAATMVEAPAGALYVLQQAGDTGSKLELAQLHCMPESLLTSIERTDGRPWTGVLLQQNTLFFDRATDPTLGGLVPATVPPVIRNVLSVPLHYLGVDTGLCVLFNVEGDEGARRQLIERVTSLARLGAAVVHRLHLESLTAHQRSIQRELQIAAAIQAHLLPRQAPVIPQLQFAWHSLSANNIGGDYLDYVASDLGDLCAIIADASGHGINSALLMSSFRSTYRAEAPWRDTDALCQHLNREVAQEVGATGMFITAAALRIERDTLRMSLCSAGHNPLLLSRQDGEVVQLEAGGPPLGFAGDGEFQSQEVQLRAGDLLLLYTDGVTEACNQDLDMFGDDRLLAILRRDRDRSPQELLQTILTELAVFTGRSRYDDDVSLSIVKVVPR